MKFIFIFHFFPTFDWIFFRFQNHYVAKSMKIFHNKFFELTNKKAEHLLNIFFFHILIQSDIDA